MTRKHSKTPSIDANAAGNTSAATLEPVPTEREILELQIGFYGLAIPAKQQEIEAHVAARLIAISAPISVIEGKGNIETRFPRNGRMKSSNCSWFVAKTATPNNPLPSGCRRAREHNIIYLPALDDVVQREARSQFREIREALPQFREFETVQHDELPPEPPSDAALEAAFKGLDSVPEAISSSPKTCDNDWKPEAVKLANEYVDAWRDAGYEPTVANASKYCEVKLFAGGFHGRGGKGDKLLADNIKRNALDEAGIGRSSWIQVEETKSPCRKGGDASRFLMHDA